MVKLSSDINLRDFGNNEYLSSVQNEAIRFATEQTDEILSLYGQHETLMVVTRNEKDFSHLGARVFNPLEEL